MKRLDRMLKKARAVGLMNERQAEFTRAIQFIPMYVNAISYCYQNDLDADDDENIKNGLEICGHAESIADLFEWLKEDRNAPETQKLVNDVSVIRMLEYFDSME